ncbi:DUF4214 domain-containing protein [Marivita hallyeonensis]|uniref:DUF4214 domain-containing protein n=1 Tax=Marivita hallyeonensis TaxID=996342 RepID=A0A1M5X4C3_9RHOB|nr:DUF4214 domain-containing protein [Marivita hallyeonensis]SHH94665.1 protein of unknown function [Marivita hallyeonensis]
MEPLTDVFGTQTSAAALAFGLRGVKDWSVQQPFLDVFKTARPWSGGGYSPEDLENMGVLDANGWLTEMPAGASSIHSYILTEMPADANYTRGLYRLSYDGEGEIEIYGADVVSRSDGEIWFDFEPNGAALVTVLIRSTDPRNNGDYLRNIEVVKQEHIPAHDAGQLFNPLWLDLIDDAHSLRFMDWQQTNDSQVSSWSDRPAPEYYTYSPGVPVEVMVALANQTGTEPWFNIPWHADATYIREFATYVRDNLNPDLRAHFELSNEVWNWMFEQAQDAQQSARDRFGQDHGDGWVQEYGARSAEMARVLDSVYAGADDRLVKVIATHTNWPGLEEPILEAPAWQAQGGANHAPYLSFDTYAITGYFASGLGTDGKAPIVLGWIEESEDRARDEAAARGLRGSAAEAYVEEHRYDHAEALAIRELRDGSVTGDRGDSLDALFDLFRYHKQVADAHGLDLVMYEGGTHVVGIGQWVHNETLSDFFAHLNYSEGMGQLYRELLQGWEDAGGTLFNAFVDVSRPTKWGSWGTLRHLEDETARYNALEDFMRDHPAPDHMKDGTWSSTPSDFGPAPRPEPDPEPDPEPTPVPQPGPAPDPQPDPDPTPSPTPRFDDVVEYAFANTHFARGNDDPLLTVPYWISVMADLADNGYANSTQSGMMREHAISAAAPELQIDGVQDAWTPGVGQSFADAGFNQITISPVNFVQDLAPDEAYWIDPNTSPAHAALQVIEWTTQQAPGVTVNIFETWPELNQFATDGMLTTSEFDALKNYMAGEWHDWWVSLTEIIQSERSDLDVRLVSAGSQIARLLDTPSLGLEQISASDLFVDEDAHGTATLYFLASLVHYITVFGELPLSSVELPDDIHPAVRSNLDGIMSFLSADIRDLPAPIVDPFRDGDHNSDVPDGDDPSVSLLEGSNSNDMLHGTLLDDRIDALDGDDVILISGGRDIVDGGRGIDIAAFEGTQSGYTLRFDGPTILVENRDGAGNELTMLSNIEWIDFAEEISPFATDGIPIGMFDGMATLSPVQMAELTELYIAYFNRAPDAVGLFFWGDQLAQGLGMDEIAALFFDQPETRALYGSMENLPAFVTAVYQNVLGRDPDVSGLLYWLDVLQNDTAITPPTFIQAILAGAKAETGSAADAEYLANKVMLGGHFAVMRGMSDVEDARAVMHGFDGTDASLDAGIAQSDMVYQSILDGSESGFLMQVVGISPDVFLV